MKPSTTYAGASARAFAWDPSRGGLWGLATFVVLLGACTGPGDDRAPPKLRIDPQLLAIEWPEGPRRDATEALVRRETKRFAQSLFTGEPMPTGMPQARDGLPELAATLEDAAKVGLAKRRAQPPAWADGVPEPPRAVEHDLPKQWPIVVRQGEGLHLLAKWAGTDAKIILEDNRERLGKRRWLKTGDRLDVTMSANQKFAFDRAREQFQKDRLDGYFASRYVSEVVVYRVKRGEPVSTAAKRFGEVPIWLLQEFNQTDFRSLQPGDEILIPVVKSWNRKEKLPPALKVVDEQRMALTDEQHRAVDGRLRHDLLGRARLAIDDSNVFERAEGGLVEDGRGVLPDYGALAVTATPTPAPGQLAAPPTVLDVRVDEAIAPREVLVMRGETLSHYAKWAGLGRDAIVAANPGLEPDRILVGTRLKLPLTDTAYATFVRARAEHHQPKQKAAALPASARPLPAVIGKGAAKAGKSTAQRAHLVRAGETASGIAKKRGTTVTELARRNPGVDLNRLQIGQSLLVP